MEDNTPFSNISDHYDDLYTYKDYVDEASIVHRAVRMIRGKPSSSLLDLGCGTGAHVAAFIKLGYDCVGLDTSRGMLRRARQKFSGTDRQPHFQLGTITSYRIPRVFDVITCLFHVISYLTTIDEVGAFFRSAKKHIAPDGVLVFDCWDTSLVNRNPPQTQYRQIRSNGNVYHKIKVPNSIPGTNIIEVKHTVFRIGRGQKTARLYEELHRLRHYSAEELVRIASTNGFLLLPSYGKKYGLEGSFLAGWGRTYYWKPK